MRLFLKGGIVAATTALAFGFAAPAFADPTVVTSNASNSGCFGQWRASSVQDLTDAGYVVGRDFFSQRAGDNSTINASNKAECAQ